MYNQNDKPYKGMTNQPPKIYPIQSENTAKHVLPDNLLTKWGELVLPVCPAA